MSDSKETGAWLIGQSNCGQIFLQVSSASSGTSMTLGLSADEAELIANQLLALVNLRRRSMPSREEVSA